MSESSARARTRRLLAATLFAVAAVLITISIVAFILRLDDDRYDDVRSGDDELSVVDALRERPDPVVVAGFVFADARWPEPRLCHGRERGEPPTCIGPYLRLAGLAVDRLPFERDGSRAWSPEPVRLLGRLQGDLLTTDEVLSR